MKYFNYLILIALLTNSCVKEDRISKPANVVITGHISNFDNTVDPNYVRAIHFDVVDNRNEITQYIDDSGYFKIIIENVYRPQEIWFGYGLMQSFYIFPDDSLHFEIDSKCIEEYRGTGNLYSFYNVSGSAETIITDIAAYKSVLYDSSFTIEYWDERREAPKNLSPKEFRNFAENDYKKRALVAEKFISTNNPCEEFRKWVEYDLKFSWWEELMRYWWLHPIENEKPKMIMEFLETIPDSYFDFLDTWDKENKDYQISIAYKNFIREFYLYKNYLFYLESGNKKSLKNSFLNYEEDIDALSFISNSGENGLILDILIAKKLAYLLDGKFEEVKSLGLIERINDAEIKEILTRKYEYAEQLSGIESSDQIIEVVTADFINALIKKHPNKVLYIDFWATWCSPCLEELIYSKQIKEYFEDSSVTFVYLANRCGETVWKKTIKERDIKGDHYLLTDKQFSNMSKTFEISGIPHYVLIDKKGNVVYKDAPRPSSGEKIINSINKLL